MRTKLGVQRHDYEDTIDFAYFTYEGEVRKVAKPLTLETLEDGLYVETPTFSLTLEQCEDLMNSLWNNGVRPSKSVMGELKSAASEIEWLRKIIDRLIT